MVVLAKQPGVAPCPQTPFIWGSGVTGSHKGLKNPWSCDRAGSSPVSPTNRSPVTSFQDKAERRLAFRTDELILRVRSKARTSLSKSDDVSSILTPSATDACSNFFKEQSVKLYIPKKASRILYGAIVYGARATQPRQEWVQFPRNPFKCQGDIDGCVGD